MLLVVVALLACSGAAAIASTPSAAASTGRHLEGGHLPFITIAAADVEVMRGATATLPYRLEGATGRSHVRIAIRTAGGTTIKTIVVAGTVPAATDEKLPFVCRLALGRYLWKVAATDARGHTAAAQLAARLTVDAVFPSPAAIDRAIAWLKGRSGVTAVAVVDTAGVLHGWHQDDPFVTASVIKAMLLVEYLRTHATVSS